MPATSPAAPETVVDDGRRVRRERNRDAVVDALLELYGEGRLQPSSDEIAERAGLSPRSLFRYFDDIDDLARAAITRQQERVLPLVPVDVEPDAPRAERIAGLVAQRLRLFDEIASVGQVSRLRAPFQPLIADELGQARAFLRGQVARLFAPELRAMGTGRAGSALAAADVLCSFESYRLLRDDQSLSRPRAAAALTAALTALFDTPFDTPFDAPSDPED
jgi:AcrR family transcriptional regulator